MKTMSFAGGEWSAWEAIEGRPHTRLEALTEPRRVLLASMVIVGLLALLYLHIASEVTLANNQLQSQRAEQLQLESQDQQLHLELGAGNESCLHRPCRGRDGTFTFPAYPRSSHTTACSARAGYRRRRGFGHEAAGPGILSGSRGELGPG